MIGDILNVAAKIYSGQIGGLIEAFMNKSHRFHAALAISKYLSGLFLASSPLRDVRVLPKVMVATSIDGKRNIVAAEDATFRRQHFFAATCNSGLDNFVD